MSWRGVVRALLVGFIGGALLLSIVPRGTAEAQVGAALSPAQASARATLAFWTAERMAAARPVPKAMLTGPTTAAAPQRVQPLNPNDTAQFVNGNAPGDGYGTGTSGPFTGPWSESAQTVTLPLKEYYPFVRPYSPPFTRSEVLPTLLYNGPTLGDGGYYPWITVGKVFFQNVGYDPSGGTFVCSGTSVTAGISGNKSLVWTAGHCVNSGGNGVSAGIWSTHVLFCPAFRDGNAPYGCWPAQRLASLPQWVNHSNFRRDQGVIVVHEMGERRLADVVGSQGLAWNYPRIQHFKVPGYPHAAPFNGQRMIWCNSSMWRDDTRLDTAYPGAGPTTLSIGCDMTGGSSGSGMVRLFRMGRSFLSGAAGHVPWGFVNSVISYVWIIPDERGMSLQGPYFDAATRNLWNAVRTISITPGE